MFHFNSEALLTPAMKSALFKAINISKSFGGDIFFDPNLPVPLLKSRKETLDLIMPAWLEADIIEVSRHELEFLLNEPYFVRKRTVPPQYYSETPELTKTYNRDYYHYTKDDLAPLWHDGIKLLIVTHGTLRIHYYTQEFDGFVIGTEDVLVAHTTCDRSGSGDAMVAAIMRKLLVLPELYKNQDLLERQLRFAVAAGIISQWTNGAIRGFPTESAAMNLKEQVYIPSMW
jgi:sugar/nucleoside kinase (ribokinase family)